MEEIVTSPKIEQENFDFFSTLGVGQQKYAHKNPEKIITHTTEFFMLVPKKGLLLFGFSHLALPANNKTRPKNMKHLPTFGKCPAVKFRIHK